MTGNPAVGVRGADQAGAESRERRRGARQAYALLIFTTACWGGNAVAGRMAVGEVSPMIVTCLRWAIVSLVLASLRPRQLLEAWPHLRRYRAKIVLMAVCGFTSFNALFYIAAHHTTAVNIAILQGAIPVLVVIGAALLHGVRVGAVRGLGIGATLIGVAVVASGGDLAALAAFQLNLGDALMLIACLFYSGYTLALKDRPDVPNLVFFAALALIAFVSSLPLLAYEVATGTALWPTATGWALLIFIALFPSFLAQVSFMRGVQLIGPGRAGLFANLAPVFGSLFAVLILGEAFALFHLVALVLVIGGILVAETAGRAQANAPKSKA